MTASTTPRILLTLALTMLALALPVGAAGVASAAPDPTAAQYGDQLSGSAGGGNPSSGTAGAEASGGLNDPVGGLPFTGKDLLALTAIAVALMFTGLTLRRLQK